MNARYGLLVVFILVSGTPTARGDSGGQPVPGLDNGSLQVSADAATGMYVVHASGQTVGIRAGVAAEVNHRWLRSGSYPRHTVAVTAFRDPLGDGRQLAITHSGLAGAPDLECALRLHSDPSFVEIEVRLRNTTAGDITVQSIRVLEASGDSVSGLVGPDGATRVLSDSFSEDRPSMTVMDLAKALDGMHRAVGSQLVFNRRTNYGIFVGALTADRWLTIARLHVKARQPRISAYEIDSTGTTEIMGEVSLLQARDRFTFSVPVPPGEAIASERVMLSLGSDYHAQLETYGDLVRQIHKARVSAPNPMGWWSWTAYYHGLNDGTALANAEYLAHRLKSFGYDFFHIDEGYSYARGEYVTPNAAVFPEGMAALEYKVRGLGLIPGIWTAPFEVSRRSSIYENHRDWLVRNADGEPLQIRGSGNVEDTFVLDTTHPGAQEYLRTTYRTLVHDWGVRYIKLDFMDESAVEGSHYGGTVSALEAQRTGLNVIRAAVGEGVLLDKDGSPMLTPVGIVDMGRISCDTGHTFSGTKEAAPGIAARYYMNRNFFVNDPDAFAVSRQIVPDQDWHEGELPLSLDEARVSIALAAVSGGMYELGDDLPTLYLDPERVALVENQELINMVRLGHAARPVDLMTYAPEDTMPSVFFLRQDARQGILTVFNWTDRPRQHLLSFADLGWDVRGHNQLSDVLAPSNPVAPDSSSISLRLPAHSVRMLKLVDTSAPAAAPRVDAHAPGHVTVGATVGFSAAADGHGTPVLYYIWNFGDGTEATGPAVTHAFTHAGEFRVHLMAKGLDAVAFEKDLPVVASGAIDTRFNAARNQRYAPGN